ESRNAPSRPRSSGPTTRDNAWVRASPYPCRSRDAWSASTREVPSVALGAHKRRALVKFFASYRNELANVKPGASTSAARLPPGPEPHDGRPGRSRRPTVRGRLAGCAGRRPLGPQSPDPRMEVDVQEQAEGDHGEGHERVAPPGEGGQQHD